MSTKPLVSVIIPAYNGEQYIQSAIDSALAQDVSCEVVVVDDGSKDGTLSKLQPYENKIVLLSKSNGGVASARNAGIRAAKGKYIALLDQDDCFLHGKLKKQLDLMEHNPNIVLTHANIRMIDDLGNPIANGHLGHKPDFPPASGNITREIFKWNNILACTTMMRADILYRTGYFNESLWGVDDYELWLRMSMFGDVIYINEVLSEYRWHDDNASKDEYRMTLGRLRARIAFLDAMPQAMERLGQQFVKDVITHYVQNFSYPLYKKGRGKEARYLLSLGLRFNPVSYKLWKMYLATFR